MKDLASPDFDRLGRHYERYLPQVHPVALALLARLPAPRPGERCLDVACGTGEPGLTLLRGFPELDLLGIDTAAGALAIAREKAAREGLTGVRFEEMSSEALALGDASVDRVLSRFGLLMFGDATRGASELARVLAPGGLFSIAVWDRVDGNTLMSSTFAALHDHLPPALRPAFAHLERLAAPGHRTDLLREAGVSRIETEELTWTMDFDDFEHAWELVAGPGVLHAQFASLSPAATEAVRAHLHAALSPFQETSGLLRVPHTCRLYWGRR